jgi:hypothetical protein
MNGLRDCVAVAIYKRLIYKKKKTEKILKFVHDITNHHDFKFNATIPRTIIPM